MLMIRSQLILLSGFAVLGITNCATPVFFVFDRIRSIMSDVEDRVLSSARG